MIKHMKKMVCFLLATIMMLAMSTTVMADEPATADIIKIIVSDTAEGETYKLYKLLDLSIDVEKEAYSYYLNTTWGEFFKAGGAGNAYVDLKEVGTTTYVTWKTNKKSDTDMEAFGKAAAAYVEENNLTAEKTETDSETSTDIIFDALDSGYYLITSTKGTLAMVGTTPNHENGEEEPNVYRISEKTGTPSITKEIKGVTTDEKHYKHAQIGDTIQYVLTVNAKKGAKNYKIVDEMDLGLTLDKDTIVVKSGDNNLTENTDYTIAYSDKMETGEEESESVKTGNIMTITFTDSYLDSITADTTITVEYSAEFNKNALKKFAANNTATLNYGSEGTVGALAQVTTCSFEVLKYAEGDSEKKPLAGAEFQLYRVVGDNHVLVKLIRGEDSQTYNVADAEDCDGDYVVYSFITVDTGNITINGVDTGEYVLKEIKAPAGYNKMSTDKQFNVRADEDLVVVEISNAKGALLPETGGMGTTIFYVVGSVLVVGAAVLLITKKRMKANE